LIASKDPKAWADLISWRPPKNVQDKVHEFEHVSNILVEGFSRVQHIEKAWGEINLDYYPVQVTKLPVLPVSGAISAAKAALSAAEAKRASAEQLFEYFRLHLTNNTLTDPDICEFSTFNEEEGGLWLSKKPLGAIVHIDMKVGGFNVDDGSVVCSHQDDKRFIFSTIQVRQDNLHPVSGNREFGFWQPALRKDQKSASSAIPVKTGESYQFQAPTYIFYTRGADRVADGLSSLAASNRVFSGARSLWRSFQKRFTTFVNMNGGSAQKLDPEWIQELHDWDDISKKHFLPTVDWEHR
jgi:hypothetical protein